MPTTHKTQQIMTLGPITGC